MLTASENELRNADPEGDKRSTFDLTAGSGEVVLGERVLLVGGRPAISSEAVVYESVEPIVVIFSNAWLCERFVDSRLGLLCVSSSSIRNIEVIPPDVLIGLGELIGNSRGDLITTGSALLPEG